MVSPPSESNARLAALRARRIGSATPIDAFSAIQAAAAQAASSHHNTLKAPTKAQAAAGNYRLGRCTVAGLPICIENPQGTERTGVDPTGKAWSNRMAAHYGYFSGTRGADGDGVDVFVGPYPEADQAWVLNQTNADGSFDEHKVLLGFPDGASALNAYRNSYDRGWNRFKAPQQVSLEQLRWWLKFADKSTPFSRDLVPDDGPTSESSAMFDNTATVSPMPTVFWHANATPAAGQTFTTLMYALRQHDGTDRLLLDAVTMADITEGASLIALDAIVVEAGRLKPKIMSLQRVMEAASQEVKPLTFQLSDPMKRNGTLNVAALFELSDGQTITIWFHNPDMTPAKFSPADELISWKWQLNKKDITLAVAPESGRDLDVREVARRIMRLAEKNSAAFKRVNANRAARMEEIAGLKDTLTAKQAELARLHSQIEVAKVERELRPPALPVAAASPAVAVLTGKELGDFPETAEGKKALRAAAREYLNGLRGTWVHCVALGQKVEIRQRGIKETLAFSGDTRKLKILAALPQLIADGKAPNFQQNYKKEQKPEMAGYFHLTTNARLAGEEIPVKLVIEVDQSGLLHYDLMIEKTVAQAKTALDSTSSAARASELAPDHYPGIPDRVIVEQALDAVNSGGGSVGTKGNGPPEGDPLPVAASNDRGTDPSRLVSHQLDAMLDSVEDEVNSGEVLNLFFEGEDTLPNAISGVDAQSAAAPPSLPVEVYPFPNATDEAKGLFAIGAQNPAPTSAYRSAVAIDKQAQSLELAVAWSAVQALPEFETAAMDDATGGLFGTGDSGYIKGEISGRGVNLAAVYLREDGMVAFVVNDRIADVKADQMVYDITLREDLEGGWRDDWDYALKELSLVVDDAVWQAEMDAKEAALRAAEAAKPTLSTESTDIAYLKDVNRGAHDDTALGDMLARIEASINALNAAGALTGEADAIASAAITHWVELDAKANG